MKRWRFVILVAVFAVIAAACANSESESTTTTAASGGDTTTTTASGGDSGSDSTTTTAAAETGGNAELAAAEAGEYAGTSVTIQGQWVDAEEEAFTGTLAAFAERTGIDIQYEGVSDHETVLTVRVEGGEIAHPSRGATEIRHAIG